MRTETLTKGDLMRRPFLFLAILAASLMWACGTNSSTEPNPEQTPLNPNQLYLFLTGRVGDRDTVILSDDSLSYVVAKPAIVTFTRLMPNKAIIAYLDTGTTCIWAVRAREAMISPVPNVCGATSLHWSSPIRLKVFPRNVPLPKHRSPA